MQAFFYSLLCPVCEKTHDSGAETILADDLEQGRDSLAKKFTKCPTCGESWEGQKVDIQLYGSRSQT